MYKKTIAVVALTLTLGLTACTGTQSEPDPVPTVTHTVTQTPEPEVATPKAKPVPMPKVTKETRTGAMTDTEFVDFVQDARPYFVGKDSDLILEYVNASCDALDAGLTMAILFDKIEKTVDTEEAAASFAFLLGAGTRIYCPEHI